ncbi:AAA family ATPase [Streptomyces abikoensis]|uniref:helix-turn-helix transcriptional regulator n=1 Tax=Streptomyces abikoensis TaxID=97398 RepID=UPI0036C239F8
MLLERGTEFTAAGDALRAAAGGRASSLLLTGPVGTGRSALLRALPGPAGGEGIRVLRAHAAPMEADFAFGVAHQLFDSLRSRAPREESERWQDDPRLTATDRAGEGPGDAAEEWAVLEGLRSLLADISAEAPLLILVDDLQWADTPSLRWLAHLATRPHGLRAAVVCTLRDGDPGGRRPAVLDLLDAGPRVLRPAALTPDATRTLVRERFGTPGDEEFTAACHDATGGNPLLLTSLLDRMAADGDEPTAAHAGRAYTLRPPQLTERLADCLRAQSRPVRHLAEALAALGGHAEPHLAAELAGLDPWEADGALADLHRLGLLTGPGGPRFAHRAVQDAVAASTTPDERRARHEAAVDLLHRHGAPAALIAERLVESATAPRPWAAAILREAAETALRAGDPETAARALRRALQDSPEPGPDRARLLADLAAAVRDTDAAACERHVTQAVSLLSDPTERALAALRIPPAFLGALPAPAIALLRRTAGELGPAALLKGTAREAALRLEARLRHAGREDPAELGASVLRLRRMGEEPALRSAGERELAAVLLYAAAVSGALTAAEAARLGHRILEHEPAAPDRTHSALPLVVLALCGADSVDAVSSWLSAGHRLRAPSPARGDGFPSRGEGPAACAVDHAERALTLLAQGRLTQAREHAERVVVHRPGEPEGEGSAAFAVVLAAVALEVRDPAFSERVLALGGRCRAPGLVTTSMLRLLEASLEAGRGDWTDALETVLSCGRQLAASGWHSSALFPWRPWAVSLHHRLGDSGAARALADEEHARAERWGAPAVLGRALRLKGRLYGGGRGEALLAEAVTVLRGSANRLELARALQELGRRLGGGPRAEAALREAGELAVACGVPRLVKRAGREELGAPGVPAAVLTPAERRVAALVGRGLTNQNIARELGVSPRAVEKHLTNSYRKLGIKGRAELAAEQCGPALGMTG